MAESAKIDLATTNEAPRKAALTKQVDDWTKTAARYQSEPEAGGGKGEGTVRTHAARDRDGEGARHAN